MEKIKFTLTGDRLAAINEAFQFLEWPAMTRQMRHSKSILVKVATKLLKKGVDKRPGCDEFKMSLEYYEADTLEQFLRGFELNDTDDYNRTLRSTVADELHQKLA